MTKELPMSNVAKAAGGTAALSTFIVRFLTLGIRVYQLTISPALTVLSGATGGCRYTPTCSAYAVDALREHGAVSGSVLAAKRICRCHPWGGCGHDPVPRKNNSEFEGRRPEFKFHG